VVGIIWTDPLQHQPDVVMPRTWVTSELSPAKLTNFLVHVYRPPPPSAIVTITAPSGDQAELAVGELVIVNDVDGDGFDVAGPHAEMVGSDSYLAAATQVLVYVARPFATNQSAFPLLVSRDAYTVMEFACNGLVSAGTMEDKAVAFGPQLSRVLPEPRSCDRTHSP
jgi:hypothetical protein